MNLSLVHSEVIFIRSSTKTDSTCSTLTNTSNSCFTLDEYVQRRLSVVQPTTLTFLPGDHDLNEPWVIQNINSQLTLRGEPSAHVLLSAPQSSLAFEGCNDVEISFLDFILNVSSSQVTPTPATLSGVVLTNSNVELVNVTFLQVDNSISNNFVVVQSQSSNVTMTCAQFLGTSGALSAHSSSIVTFAGRNVFEDNTAELGGAIYSQDSRITLSGENNFINNKAISSIVGESARTGSGGAIYCENSTLNINGSVQFVNNSADSAGGAIVVRDSVLVVGGLVRFLSNSAQYNGGACFIDNSSAMFRESVYFDRNSVTAVGKLISTKFNLDQISTNGGAIYSSYSFLNLTGTSLTNQISTGSGGALFISSGTIVIHDVIMINNSASFYAGGLRGIVDQEGGGSLTMSGTNMFDNNSGQECGGALEIVSFSMVLINGTNNFSNNYVVQGRGAALCFAGTKNVTFYGTTYVENNIGCAVTADFRNNGSGIDSDRRTGTELLFIGETFFINNSYSDGGALCSLFSNISVLNKMVFENNSGTNGAAIASYDSELIMRGNQYFTRNIATQSGGAVYSENSSWILTGEQTFQRNSAYQGGAMFCTFRNTIIMFGRQYFLSNTAVEGGAIYSFANLLVSLTGEQVFEANSVVQGGGAVSIYDSIWTMTGNQLFIRNEGVYGGAMALQGSTSLILTPPSVANFTENLARTFGGAIYFEDSISSIQCSEIFGRPRDCFLVLNDSTSTTNNISLVFDRNQAGTSGSVMFGGELNYCSLYIGYTDKFGAKIEQFNNNLVNPVLVVRGLSTITSDSKDDTVSDITSLPVQVCTCDNRSTVCDVNQIGNLTLMPGQMFNLTLGVVGQDVSRTVVPAFVLSTETANTSLYPPMQSIQNLCAVVSYRLLSDLTNIFTQFELYPDGPCQALRGGLVLSVEIISCPPGFVLLDSECRCEERLRQLNKTCYIDNLSIEREENDIWMKPLYHANNSYNGLLIHKGGCPFDFCVDKPINLTLTDYDIQCAHDHSGILCGSCRKNFSLAFGTLHCLPRGRCSNSYLALILVFIVAGILLVACLFVLNLTVAIGTVNGLIFYANIVQANRHVFFPPGETRPLEVFIAWLNLDFGIETCFYVGMNTYVYAWLQFVFPFYVWFLITLIIVISRYSQTVTKYLGKNPVPILATLLLLSYAKILNSIIIALSQTSLTSPDRSEIVWLYDGNIPYFQGKHIALGLFAVFTLVFLFLPYTLLLFSGHWFQTFSNWKPLTWLNNLKPLLDAYYAPFRKKGRYWVGLLLFTRLALIMTFAFNALGNDGINLLAISSVTTALSVMKGRVYERRSNDILESSFVLNLCLFSVVTFYLIAEDMSENQFYVSNISVGISLLTFIGIVVFHVFLRLCSTSQWKNTISPFILKLFRRNKAPITYKSKDNDQETPTSSIVTIELREPLLESGSSAH